jgi:hypothetical protein
MKLYLCHPEFANDELIWRVYETNSQQFVAEFFFEEDAQELCDFLSRGGGFAGFTPSFILQKVPVKNINENFTANFA